MTMPNERTRSLIFAAEFLQELRFGDDTPSDIRRTAIHIQRHFPEVWSIETEARRQMRRMQDGSDLNEPWLLPINYYDQI